MKICITSKEASLNSEMDPRFGRCVYFIFVETTKSGFEAFANKYTDEAGGSGIQSGQFVCEQGAEVVITGSMGPNAYNTLNAAGIKIITGVSGIIKDVLFKYKSGELKPVENLTVSSHSGIKGGN